MDTQSKIYTITSSPMSLDNPILQLRADNLMERLQAIEPPPEYVSPNLPPAEKYGVEALRELIVMVVVMVGLVLNNSNIKSWWQVFAKPFEIFKALKALYDAAVFITKKYKDCYHELTDLSRNEAWLLMNILVNELKAVLGKPGDPEGHLTKYE